MPRHLKNKADNSAKNAASIDVSGIVKGVIDSIREHGDAAVRRYSEQFDQWSPPTFRLSKEAIDAAIAALPKQTVDDIKEVQANVRKFAEAQRASLKDFEIEMSPGVHLGQRNNPLNAVGTVGLSKARVSLPRGTSRDQVACYRDDLVWSSADTTFWLSRCLF